MIVKPFVSLSRRLVIAVLIFSAAYTCLGAVGRLVLDYREGKAKLEQQLLLLVDSHREQLAAALWDVDNVRVESLLRDMARNPWVSQVELKTALGQMWRVPMADVMVSGDAPSLEASIASPVGVAGSVNGGVLAYLRVVGNWQELDALLRSELLKVLASQLVSTLALVFLVTVLVDRLLTRHVRQLAQHLVSLTPENLMQSPSLLLRQPRQSEDELDILEREILRQEKQMRNHLQERENMLEELRRHRYDLEALVEERTHQLNEAVERLHALARLDHLTDIANRRHFDEVAQREYQRAIRHGTPLALLVVDVDFFKQYNDNYGHTQGDSCLVAVASVLKQLFRRSGDLPVRLGGEEFGVLLAHTDFPAARLLAERLRADVEALGIQHEYSGAASVLTVSIGVSVLDNARHASFQEFFEEADEALYRAKSTGRNRVAVPLPAACEAEVFHLTGRPGGPRT